MARQLRIEYPGAFYHVYSRGNQRQAIFYSDEDRYYFLKVLGDAHEKYGSVFHTYCLMPNHYHMIAETPLGNLSKIMHLVNTTYTVHLNKKQKRCGHLFQGRFKSILIEAESYAQELSRYIHLNPVRAKLVGLPEEYPWSSYREYLGTRKPYPWVDLSLILGCDGNHLAESRSSYAAFVLAGIGKDPPAGYRESSCSGILGSGEFIDQIKARFLTNQLDNLDREMPQLRVLRTRVNLADILALTEKILGPQNRLIKGTAIYLGQRTAGYTLEEISAFYNMSISGISNARRRIQNELEHNETLVRAVQEIVKQLRE